MDEQLQQILEEYKQKTIELLVKIIQLNPRPETLPQIPLEVLFYINYLLDSGGGGGGAEGNVTIVGSLPGGDNNIGNVNVLTLPLAYDLGATTTTTTRIVTASDSPEIDLLAAIANKDFATQATLAAILAELRDDIFVTSTLWEDRTATVAVFYREERIRSQDDGTVSTIYTRLSDNVVVVSMPAGVIPVQGASDRAIEYFKWRAKNTGTNYTAGDWISNTVIFDTDGNGAVLSSSWYNLSTSVAISAPLAADLEDPNDKVALVVGDKSDSAATSDTGSFSIVAFIKRSLQNWTTLLARIPVLVSGRIPVDASGVISGSVTANIGTSGNLALDATLTGGAQKAIARGGTKGATTAADVTSTSVDANTQALDVSVKGNVSVGNFPGTLNANAIALTTSSYYNDPNNYIDGTAQLQMDSGGNLRTRGAVTTEEGGSRFDFPGSLFTTIAGTVTFTNGSPTITGTGTAFTTLKNNLYIKKTSDANSLALQIESIDSNTQITLSANYAGTTGTATADVADFFVNTGGGTVSVASSLVSIASGTANGNNPYILKKGDYLPYSIRFNIASISQRIANQTITIGLVNQYPNPTSGVYVQFTGTASNTVTFVSQSSGGASDIQSTVVTRTTLNTLNATDFQIDVSNGQATLLINNLVVATHKTHLPDPYQILSFVAAIANSATVTTTTLNLDYILLYNTNQLEITSAFLGEPIKISEDWRYQEYELPLAIGNSRTIVCPAGIEWEIVSISIVWNTLVAVGNRLIAARIEDALQNVRSNIFVSSTGQSNNLTRNYEATKSGFNSGGFVATSYMFFNIGDQIVGNGRVIRILDLGVPLLSIADTFSAILRVRERNT